MYIWNVNETEHTRAGVARGKHNCSVSPVQISLTSQNVVAKSRTERKAQEAGTNVTGFPVLRGTPSEEKSRNYSGGRVNNHHHSSSA